MTEKNKAARGNGQPEKDSNTVSGRSTTDSLATPIIPQLTSMFDGFPVKLIRLRGYSTANKKEGDDRYSEAKTPIGKWGSAQPLTEEESQEWGKSGGWLGLVIPDGFDLVDVDDRNEGELLRGLLRDQGLRFYEMQTKNGFQFFFKTSGKLKRQTARFVTALGIVCDYRISGKGYTVLPTENTEGRSWNITETQALSETPFYLEPTPKSVSKPEDRPFSVPIQEARNNAVHKWLSTLVEFNLWSKEQLQQIGEFIFKYVCSPSYYESDGKEAAEQTINQALKHKPSGKNYEDGNYRAQLSNNLDILPGRPGPEKVKLPSGWTIDENTLSLFQYTKNGDVLVSHNPVIVTGGYENLTDQTQGLVVAYLKNKKWRTIHKGRDYLMTHSKLVELSATGFPVSSINARNLVKFIQDYEARNAVLLPLYQVSEQLGYVEDGFLIGKTFIDSEGNDVTEMTEGAVTFSGADSGDEQFVEGFSTAGNLENWLEAIEKTKNYPRVFAGVLASFASVLAPIVKSNTFIYELAGETSKGKTIALRTFASVWGNPDEMEGGIVRKWNTTPVNLERMAGIVNHLPLFLDDTKEANEKHISQAVYQLASGQGKGRGSTKGTQRTKNWRNVIFSTGEQKITSFSKDGGTAARTISVLGMPFHSANLETYQMVNALDMAVKENYGHAGRHFIKAVLKSRNDWPQWREAWTGYRNHFAELVTDVNSVAGRLAAYMALIALAGELFCKIFNRKWDVVKIIETLWDELIRDNAEADRPLEALQKIYGHIRANQATFHQQLDNDPPAVCWGEWEKANGQWKDIKMIPALVEEALEKLGYEPKAMLKSWNDRGWLDTSKGRGVKKRVKRQGSPVEFIALKREALEH